MLAHLQHRARLLKAEVFALYLAMRDPRVPWFARVVVACVVAYAFSPIDLIPDPIPILGYLDDLIVLPLGIAWALKLIPPAVMAECRARAALVAEQPTLASRVAAGVIVGIWIMVAAAITIWALRFNAA